MFTQTRSAGVLLITCRRCGQTHQGNDNTARTFKREHLDECPRRTR